MKFLLTVLTVFLTVLSSKVSAEILEINLETDKTIQLGDKIEYYRDDSKNQTIQTVIDKKFIKSNSIVPNFGINNANYWIKLNLKNSTNYTNFLLGIASPTIDEISFFKFEDGAFYETKLGEIFPFHRRKYKDPEYLFDIQLLQGETKTYYLKISSRESLQLPIYLGAKDNILNDLKFKDFISGLYVGILMALLIYNLFLFISVRDSSYLYYVVFVILVLLTQSTLQGYPFKYLYPNSPEFAQLSLFIFPSTVGIASLLFMNAFLKVKNQNKTLYILSLLLIIPYCIAIILALLGSYVISFTLIDITAGLVIVFVIFTSIYVMKKGNKYAIYFLTAWLVFIFGVLIYILKDLNVLPYNNYTRYTMQFGSAIETLLLSFALGARINELKKQKEQVQLQAYLDLAEKERFISSQHEEKKVLLQEIHHRVKNNLQVITSLLRLQASEITSKEAKAHFDDAINRIMTMSLIHQKMYQENELSNIETTAYFETLINDLIVATSRNIPITVKVESHLNHFGMKTVVPLALLLSEMITNSLKHAFDNDGSVNLYISDEKNGRFNVVYSDNGSWKNSSSESTFGLQLIETLVEQLNGTLKRVSDEKGTIYYMEFDNLDI